MPVRVCSTGVLRMAFTMNATTAATEIRHHGKPAIQNVPVFGMPVFRVALKIRHPSENVPENKACQNKAQCALFSGNLHYFSGIVPYFWQNVPVFGRPYFPGIQNKA